MIDFGVSQCKHTYSQQTHKRQSGYVQMCMCVFLRILWTKCYCVHEYLTVVLTGTWVFGDFFFPLQEEYEAALHSLEVQRAFDLRVRACGFCMRHNGTFWGVEGLWDTSHFTICFPYPYRKKERASFFERERRKKWKKGLGHVLE